MAHTDRIGHGSEFHRSADGTSSGSFAKVGDVRDITPPNLSRDAVESTDNASVDRYHEYISGMRDGGESSFEITFDPGSSEMTAFLAEYNSNSLGYYKIVFPDATEWGFAGLVTGISPATPMGDKMSQTITIKVSGKPGFIA